MRKYIRAAILSAVLLVSNSCVPILRIPTSTKPNPDRAAISAIFFAKEAFIDLNQPGAYEFLSEELRRKFSLDQYINVIAQMHPKRFPKEVTATEYEPVPDKEAVYIWLYGENGDEKFYYRLRMEGTTATGYKVAEMLRVVRLPATQSRKPLPTSRSTAGLR